MVDNGSTDGSDRMVAERYPEFRLIPMGSNLGFAAAVNEGIRQVEGRAGRAAEQRRRGGARLAGPHGRGGHRPPGGGLLRLQDPAVRPARHDPVGRRFLQQGRRARQPGGVAEGRGPVRQRRSRCWGPAARRLAWRREPLRRRRPVRRVALHVLRGRGPQPARPARGHRCLYLPRPGVPSAERHGGRARPPATTAGATSSPCGHRTCRRRYCGATGGPSLGLRSLLRYTLSGTCGRRPPGPGCGARWRGCWADTQAAGPAPRRFRRAVRPPTPTSSLSCESPSLPSRGRDGPSFPVAGDTGLQRAGQAALHHGEDAGLPGAASPSPTRS